MKRGSRVKFNDDDYSKFGFVLEVYTLGGRSRAKVAWDDGAESNCYEDDLIEISPKVNNVINGSTNGPVIQAGDIHGGVRLDFGRNDSR